MKSFFLKEIKYDKEKCFFSFLFGDDEDSLVEQRRRVSNVQNKEQIL